MHLVRQDGGRDVVDASDSRALLTTQNRHRGYVTIHSFMVKFIKVRILAFKGNTVPTMT